MPTPRVPDSRRLREPKRNFTPAEILKIAEWAAQGKSSGQIGRYFDPPRPASVIWNLGLRCGVKFCGGSGGAPKGGHAHVAPVEPTITDIQRRRSIAKKGFASEYLLIEEEPDPPPAPRRPFVSVFDRSSS